MSGRVVKLRTKSDLRRIDESVTEWDETLVEEGLYIVAYRRWSKVKQFGSERYIVEFQIVDGEHAGKISLGRRCMKRWQPAESLTPESGGEG